MHDAERLVLLDGAFGVASDDAADAAGSTNAGVNWMTLDASGVLVCGTATGVQAWNMADRSFLWKNASPRARDTQRGWIVAGRVFIETRDGQLRSIDLDDATISAPFVATSGGPGAFGAGISGTPSRPGSVAEWGDVRDVVPHGVESLGGEEVRILVHCAQRIAWYDANGNALGSDAIQDQRNFRWVLPASDRTIVISALQPRQEPVRGRDGGGRRTHYLYSIYALSANGRLLDDPLQMPALFEPVRDAQLIDGWLLLSTQAHTIAVPFPVR
jgi:hypothetical protein